MNTKPEARESQSSTNGTVSVHIERLVLEGFDLPRAQLQRFRSTLIRELERRLTRGDFNPEQSLALARSHAPIVKLSAAGLDGAAAGNVANAVVSGLSAASSGGLHFPNSKK